MVLYLLDRDKVTYVFVFFFVCFFGGEAVFLAFPLNTWVCRLCAAKLLRWCAKSELLTDNSEVSPFDNHDTQTEAFKRGQEKQI